jgi:hypothetical protein
MHILNLESTVQLQILNYLRVITQLDNEFCRVANKQKGKSSLNSLHSSHK